MSTTAKPKHIGRNISRIRELRGIKQEALALAIGVSQQTISNIENSEHVEDDKLELIAGELGVTAEAIKNFSEDAVINFFNSFNDNKGNIYTGDFCTFNPLDKLMEAYEENKKLYERLLEAEKEKNSYLEKLLNRN